MDRCSIRLDGADAGELRWYRDGSCTVFLGRCPLRPGLVRLSVYGQGREGYLGVMEPEEGELRLRRRLSRLAMAGFPETIRYAAPAGERPTPPPGRATETLWYAVGDGTLVTRTEQGILRAVPLVEGRLPAGAAERRIIEGVAYAVLKE